MTGVDSVVRQRLEVEGIVQGVGFRPFVHRLATGLGLAGWVRNDAGSVVVEVEGPAAAVDAFARRVRADAPPLAAVVAVAVTDVATVGADTFAMTANLSVCIAFWCRLR